MRKILRYLLMVQFPFVHDRKTGKIRQSIYNTHGCSTDIWDEKQQKYVNKVPYHEIVKLRTDLTRIQRIKINIATALKIDLFSE